MIEKKRKTTVSVAKKKVVATAKTSKSVVQGHATIMDVARLSGVSKKTVSRVINDSELVQEQTRAKVQAVIDQLGYAPDPQARGLSSRYAYLIGMIFDNPTAQYIVSMQYGILDGLRDSGFELVVHPCDSKQPNYIESVKRFVKQQRLYGVILIPRVSEDESLAAAMRELGVEYIRIAAVSLDQVEHMIVTNDRYAGQEVARYFESLGHRVLAHISGPMRYRSAIERSEGFAQGLAERGIKLDTKYIYEGGYTFESGVAGAQHLLSLSPRPTAIFAANDQMAAGVYKAAQRMGLRIPEQLSVAGYDDSPIAVQMWPTLTTCHVPVRLLGQQAAKALLSQRQSKSSFAGSAIQPNLVIRESSQPPQK
jgi:LacI family transcriptional regulator